VQVHYDEGLANHIGPEPCGGVREAICEASAGDRKGQPLSWVLTLCKRRKARRTGALLRTPGGPGSETLACADAPCAGTGRSHA
jgi:hypothetical protein